MRQFRTSGSARGATRFIPSWGGTGRPYRNRLWRPGGQILFFSTLLERQTVRIHDESSGCRATPVDGFEIYDGGVPSKVEDVLANAVITGAAALLS